MKARQDRNHPSIRVDRARRDFLSAAILCKELEERCVAEILFQVRALIQILGVDLRHRQAVASKMFGKLQEGDVLFAHAVENADRTMLLIAKANDASSRGAKLVANGAQSFGGRAEMLLKELLENVHEPVPSNLVWRYSK